MKNHGSLVFDGDTFVGWAKRLDELDRAITPGDEFAFSVKNVRISEEFLRRLRCLNLADFEVAERATGEFRHAVVLPLLRQNERANISSREPLQSFFRRTWMLSDAEVEAASEIFVTLGWLMQKQTGQTVNNRLHQAFDFVALFYDIYSLEYSDPLVQAQKPVREQLAGLFDRYHQETNEWVRFGMGYVLVDFIGDRMDLFEVELKSQVEEVFVDYAQLLKKWTGRIWMRG